jgi:hypothetical protein
MITFLLILVLAVGTVAVFYFFDRGYYANHWPYSKDDKLDKDKDDEVK